MSYQKPEKEFGEGPVRFPAYSAKRTTINQSAITENPQDQNHSDQPKG